MKIPISFREIEKELYDYAKSKRCPSAYIKDLIEADMKKSQKKEFISNNTFKEMTSSDFEIDI